MTYQVKQTRRFGRQYKKLNDNVAADVDNAIVAISSNPGIGDKKKGNLALLRVYKFKSQGQLNLLGYTQDDGLRLIYLESIVPHENIHRDLTH